MRNFAVSSAYSVADDWFNNPIQVIGVSPTGGYSTTADGACQVALANGLIAYVKPRPDAEKKLLIAREKIAADLAHLLDLPAAPVVIRRPAAPDWAYFSAMSLSCLPSARGWAQGTSQPTAHETLEALRLFWSWIGDSDHNGNPGNLLFEVTPSGCSVVAVDHAHTLCHGNQANSLAVPLSQGYGTATLANLEDGRHKTASSIIGLKFNEVDRIVRRLGEILTSDEQNRILKILDDRLALLKPFVKV